MKIINKIRGYSYDAVILDDLAFPGFADAEGCVIVTKEADLFKDCLGTWTCSTDEAIDCPHVEACSMAALATPQGCVGIAGED